MTTAYQLRIYTEALGNGVAADEIIRYYFGTYGFTKYYTRGFWDGTWEQSVVYEIIIRHYSTQVLATAKKATKELKTVNHQDAVYLTLTPIKETLL